MQRRRDRLVVGMASILHLTDVLRDCGLGFAFDQRHAVGFQMEGFSMKRALLTFAEIVGIVIRAGFAAFLAMLILTQTKRAISWALHPAPPAVVLPVMDVMDTTPDPAKNLKVRVMPLGSFRPHDDNRDRPFGPADVHRLAEPAPKSIDVRDSAVLFRVGPKYLANVFSLPAYGPAECGQLKAQAQARANPIITTSQGTYREIMAAAKAATAYRLCVGRYRPITP
jgi:hypothetical protein